MHPLPPLDIDVRDTVRFPHCTVEADGVHDRLSGALIKVNDVGRRVVDLCDGTRTLGEVVTTLADQFGVARERVQADLLTFLDQMERRGHLWVRRDMWARFSPRALLYRLLHLFSLKVTRTERRRYPATAVGCVAATLRATRLPVLLGVATAPPLAYVTAIQPAITLPTALLAASVPLLAVVFVQATVWLHELGHLYALPEEARPRAYFTARSLLVTLSFDPASATNTRVLAMSGPLWAVAGCALVAVGLTVTDLPTSVLLAPLLVALGHLASLAPWAQDGRLLWRSRQPLEDAHVA